jgi:hypothetical protein
MGLTEYYGANIHKWEVNLGFIILLWAVWLSIAGFVLANVRHQNR